MTSGYLRLFIRPFVFTIAALLLGGGAPAKAASVCPAEIPGAITAARDALQANDPAQDRRALECLIEAIGALSAEVKGIRDGTIPMSGNFRQWSGTADEPAQPKGAQP